MAEKSGGFIWLPAELDCTGIYRVVCFVCLTAMSKRTSKHARWPTVSKTLSISEYVIVLPLHIPMVKKQQHLRHLSS